MPIRLGEINRRIVDLKLSEIDEDKSTPGKGEFVFKKKVYLDKRDYYASTNRPKWWFWWERYDSRNGYLEYEVARQTRGASAVLADDPDCPFWPEPLKPNADGKYVLGDALWVKCPLEEEIARRKELEKLNAQRTGEQMYRQFNQAAKAEGAGIEEEDMQKILRSLGMD